MRLLFVTDLHGCIWKYDRLYSAARRHRADVVLNGGDMLPKEGDLFRQDHFITGFLRQHFQKFENAGIYCLCYLGNDDLKIFDPLFEETCGRFHYIHNLAQQKIKIQEIEFIGMNWVVDYPFRLKDRCLKDTATYVFQRQLGKGVLSTPQGWQELDDWPQYAGTPPTIADELEKLPQPDDSRLSIYMIHMPPAKLGLDVCGNGERVGSEAIHQFLKVHQPGYALHGHIHESPEMSGIWKAYIGKTLCIQPGQSRQFTFVIIDLETNRVERHIE